MPQAKPKTKAVKTRRAKPKKVACPKVLVHPEEMFCRLVATGSSATDAYREAFPNWSSIDQTVWPRASKLRDKFGTRIEELKAELKKQTVQPWIADSVELLQFHTRNIRTPLAEVPEDSDLIQEITRTYEGGQRGKLKRGPADEGNEIIAPVKVTEKVKLVSKMDSAREIAKINGHYAKQEIEVSVFETPEAILERAKARGLMGGMKSRG